MKLKKRDFNFLALTDNINYVVEKMDDGRELIKVEKKVGGVNYLEIFPDSNGTGFIVNVVSGTIKNPKKDGFGMVKKWYTLYDKSLDVEEVKKVMVSYDILN